MKIYSVKISDARIAISQELANTHIYFYPSHMQRAVCHCWPLIILMVYLYGNNSDIATKNKYDNNDVTRYFIFPSCTEKVLVAPPRLRSLQPFFWHSMNPHTHWKQNVNAIETRANGESNKKQQKRKKWNSKCMWGRVCWIEHIKYVFMHFSWAQK